MGPQYFDLEFFIRETSKNWLTFRRMLPDNEKISHSREINQWWKLTACKKKGGVKFGMSLSAVSLLCLGERGLEVCGHGHWPDIPLDVCTGVHTGICGTLSSSLAGRNDLESHHWRKLLLTLKGRLILYKKIIYLLIFLRNYKSHSLMLPQVIKRLLTEKRDKISLIDSSGHINSLWGQKANSENIAPHHSILTLSRIAHAVTFIK